MNTPKTICDKRGDHRVRGTGYSVQPVPPEGQPFVEEPCEDCDALLRLYEKESMRRCERTLGRDGFTGHTVTVTRWPIPRKAGMRPEERPWVSRTCLKCGCNVVLEGLIAGEEFAEDPEGVRVLKPEAKKK